MRIGFDAKRYFLNRTGLGNYARNTVDSLETFFPENRFFLYSPRTDYGVGLPAATTTVRTPRHRPGRLGSALWRSLLLTKIIKKDNLDIFHGLSHELPLGIQNASCRSIVTIHDLIFLRMPGLYTRTDARIYRLKYKASCAAADLVIAISQSTRNDLLQIFNIPENKIRIAYQSCNPIFFQKHSREKTIQTRMDYALPEDYLLYVGALAPRKNTQNLIRALCNLGRTEIPPLVLVGQGNPKYVRDLMSFAEKNGVKERIYHLPRVSTADLPALYRGARIFIYPSLYEGFGIPVLEALCSETPVITSNNSCLREAGGEGAWYIDPFSPEEMAQAIKEILSDMHLQSKMIQAGREHAEDFRPEKTAKQLMGIYRELA